MNTLKLIVGFLLPVILIPVILAVLMKWEIFSKALGDANGWLGYWGGYLGALMGAITVFIATSLQLKAQEKLHNQTLIKQEESIKISAKLADRQQRELALLNLNINKIDNVTQDIIHINSLNADRFNILSSYNNYNHLFKEINKIIERERKLKGNIVLNKEILQLTKTKKVKKMKIEKKRHKPINLEKAIEIRNNYISKKEDYLDKEVGIRNEIMTTSARIKSNAMFIEGLEDDLNDFRVYQTYILDLFYEKIREDSITLEVFEYLIDKHSEKIMQMCSEAMRKCKKRLDEEKTLFLK